MDQAIELERHGRIVEAQKLLHVVIRKAEAEPRDNIRLAVALNNLGVLYGASDRHGDAERQFKRSIRVLERLQGDMAEQLLARTRLHLAALYIESGRSRDLLRMNIPEIAAALRKPEDQMRAKGIMAGVAIVRKNLHEAEQISLEALAFWRDPVRAAASKAETAITLNHLGVIALWQGRSEAARDRLRESFEIWEQILGPAGPMLVKSMANVASAYLQAKQYDEAAAWLARSAELGRSTFGESHYVMVAIHSAHADALRKAGRKAEAKEIARIASEARRGMRRSTDADHTVDYRDLMPADVTASGLADRKSRTPPGWGP
jgi:tetratricopeptide (TPR) repeat protein